MSTRKNPAIWAVGSVVLQLTFAGCGQPMTDVKPLCTDQDREILRLINSGDLREAERRIDEEILRTPSDPKLYFLKATHAWYARYLAEPADNRDSMKALLRAHAVQTIRLAEEQTPSAASLFYLGSGYSYLSRVDIMDQNWFDAYSHARQGKRHLERVLEEHPELHDARLDIGILRYFTATRLTGWQEALAFLTGMNGERESALQWIAMTADQGEFHRDQARMALSVIYNSLEGNDSLAWVYTEPYHAMYPNNRFIQREQRSLALSRFVQEFGTSYLEAHADSLRGVFGITEPNALNTLGYKYVTLNRLDEALTVFRVNLEAFPDVANCYDSYAEAHMLKGNRQEAIRYYTLAYEKIDTDRSINEAFRETLRESIRQRLGELNSGDRP